MAKGTKLFLMRCRSYPLELGEIQSCFEVAQQGVLGAEFRPNIGKIWPNLASICTC